MIALAALVGWGARGAHPPARRSRLADHGLADDPALACIRAAFDYLGVIADHRSAFLDARRACRLLRAPSRFYLLGVATSLATAWVVIVDRRERHPQPASSTAWCRSLPGRSRRSASSACSTPVERRRSIRAGDRHRRPADHGAAGDQGRGAAAARAVGGHRARATSSTGGCGAMRTLRRRSRCCSASSPASR